MCTCSRTTDWKKRLLCKKKGAAQGGPKGDALHRVRQINQIAAITTTTAKKATAEYFDINGFCESGTTAAYFSFITEILIFAKDLSPHFTL